MKNIQIDQVEVMAKNMRLHALEMAYKAGEKGAHLGGGLSCIEILAVLYGGIASLKSEEPLWKNRDRILISKAHAVLAYYTALNEKGFISTSELMAFEQEYTEFPGHPLKLPQKGIEYAGGSLGMALSVGAGMAAHAKRVDKSYSVYVLLGDGECEEGSIWEAVMFANKNKLDNLIAIVDRNHLQYDGSTEEVAGFDEIEKKFEAFGWVSVNVDGHDVGALIEAFMTEHVGRPLAIIADTVKGKGVSFMENNSSWHHAVLSESLYKQALEELCEE